MLFFLYFIKSRVVLPHLGETSNLYAVENPGLLIYSMVFRDSPITLFDHEREHFQVFPVGLHPLSLLTFALQVWHTYRDRATHSIWLELENDPLIRASVTGNSLQAMKVKPAVMMHFVMIPGTKLFRIRSQGLCLTASKTKSIERDAYPLRLEECDESSAQNFYFESKMKALCKLKSPLCPKNSRDVENAESILVERLIRISSVDQPARRNMAFFE